MKRSIIVYVSKRLENVLNYTKFARQIHFPGYTLKANWIICFLEYKTDFVPECQFNIRLVWHLILEIFSFFILFTASLLHFRKKGNRLTYFYQICELLEYQFLLSIHHFFAEEIFYVVYKFWRYVIISTRISFVPSISLFVLF